MSPNFSYSCVGFVYSNGAMTYITPGTSGAAYSINDSGQVVGYYDTDTFHAFLYSNGAMTDLGHGGASDINASGQVVGELNPPNDFSHAFLYSNGTMTDLGLSGATAINANGQVVGYYAGGAALWSNGTLTDLGTLPGGSAFFAEACDINAVGKIVGTSYITSDVYHAFLNYNGTMTDLNTLIPSDSGWTLEEASGINDSGWIVGYGTNPSGQTHAFLLTAVPEPSTLALLAAGAIGLLGFAWRRKLAGRLALQVFSGHPR
jgi:probable HAF family extracellular repeat protein